MVHLFFHGSRFGDFGSGNGRSTTFCVDESFAAVQY